MTSEPKNTRRLQLNLIAALVTGALALIALAQGSSENAVVFGYSLSRAALLAAFSALLISLGFVLQKSTRRNFWESRLGGLVDRLVRLAGWILFLALAASSYTLLFSSDEILGRLASSAERLYPIALWFGILSFLFAVQSARSIFSSSMFFELRSLARPALAALIVLGGLTALIAATKIGLTPDVDYWQGPGVPLLFYQALIAALVGMAFQRLKNDSSKNFFAVLRRSASKYSDAIVCVALWALAFFAWSSYPVKPSYGSLRPFPPNFQSYPFGDALILDINAQSFWIGQPIPNDFWEKPFYSFFLAVLHGLAGQNYETLLFLQVAVFAFIPVMIYLIAGRIANRAAGMTAALLIVFRELNGLSLSNVVLVSHSKLLMSDVFALELVLLVTLPLIYWIRDPLRFRSAPLLTGGIFGLLVLTRGHALLLLPFIALGVWLAWPGSRRIKAFVEPALLFSFGLGIVLGAWIWRNYEMTGKFSVQNPASTYATQIARLYSLTPTESPARLPGEDDAAYYARIKSQPLEFFLEHPQEVIRFVSAHFFHNIIYSYLYLPQSLRIETPTEFVKRTPFWFGGDEFLPAESKGFLLLNFLLLALGFASVWKRSGRTSLMPLLLFVGYNLSVSIGRLSGWRLIQPVDWVTLLFYAAGWMQLAALVRPSFARIAEPSLRADDAASTEKIQPSPLNWIGVALIFLMFVFISLALTQGHLLTRTRYPEKSAAELAAEIESPAMFSADELQRFVAQPGAVAYHGRGLYPSFMPSGEGELNYFFLAFAPRPYARLAFQLIGPTEIGVVLPLTKRVEYFPSGAEATVVGCFTENDYISNLPGYVDALMVVVKSDPPVIYAREPMPALICPLP